MSGIILAWLAGESIITYRWVKAGAPPTPGALAMGSGLFVLAALLAEYPPARFPATLLAVGVDIAAALQLVGKAPATQQTGWPPLLINDPSVFLPAGSNGKGQLLPEGANAPGPGPGGSPPATQSGGPVPNPSPAPGG